MSHHILELKDISHQYSDGTLALSGLSLRILHGESVAIVGANGSGKTSMLLHLNGCLAPSQGEIRIGELPIRKKTLQHIRKTVGMVFQDPDDQLFMPTVYEDVAFGPLNMGYPEKEIENRVQSALEKVGGNHLINRVPYRLSGGEKRMVAIATVLAMEPDILVMDEPTANLDPKARRRLISWLKTFFHTKIIATHDLDMALEVCDRTVILYQGKLRADGKSCDILKNKELLEENDLELPLSLLSCPVCNKQKIKATEHI